MGNKIQDFAIFGAISGIVLFVFGWILETFIFGARTASIQFALIKQPLQVAVPGATTLGGAFMEIVSKTFGFGVPTIISSLLIAIIGGAIAVLIGLFAYKLVHEMLKVPTLKSMNGKVALILFYGGLFGGFILSFLTKLPLKLPAFSTAITLAISAYLTAWILILIMSRIKQLSQYVPSVQ